MNIVVANRGKNIIYSANIEIVKEITGVFKVEEIYNYFKTTFYRKIIIDATALADFPNSMVLEKLARSFDLDKIILLLPNDSAPPKEFLSHLVTMGIYNFTDNVQGLKELVERSNTIEEVRGFIINKNVTSTSDTLDFQPIPNTGMNIVLGIKNITDSAGATTLIYMLKKQLELKNNFSVIGVEVDKQDFLYFNDPKLESIKGDKLQNYLSTKSNVNLILVDLTNNNYDGLCTDILYLVEPSMYKINRLVMQKRTAFSELKGKKIILNKSMLNEKDTAIFAKEAGISVYFNLPSLNDRALNPILDELLDKLGVVESENKNTGTKKGLFNLFK